MATKFTVGNYYKDNTREVVYLVTSRTKCFIHYKEFWISDLSAGKSYQDGKIKVRVKEDNEYILIDGFCEVNSCNNYEYATEEVKEELTFEEVKTPLEVFINDIASRENWILSLTEDELDNSGLSDQEVSFWIKNNLKDEVKEVEVKEVKEVEEYYSAVHKNFLKVGQKFTYVDLENNELQDVIFEDANGRGTILNFRAVDKNGNKYLCDGSLFVVTVSNRDCLKPFEEEKYAIEEDLKFDEVREYAENCGYTLTNNAECGYCNFSLYSTNRIGEFTYLTDVMDAVKAGKLLQGEFSNLPFSMTYEEVKEYALSCGYTFNGWHNGYLLKRPEAKDKYYNSLNQVMDAVKSGELLRGESCDLPPLPKFLGMDENKLCFEYSGDREYQARAISLDYLKSHQSVIQNPGFTDLSRWVNYTNLMGKVLANS